MLSVSFLDISDLYPRAYPSSRMRMRPSATRPSIHKQSSASESTFDRTPGPRRKAPPTTQQVETMRYRSPDIAARALNLLSDLPTSQTHLCYGQLQHSLNPTAEVHGSNINRTNVPPPANSQGGNIACAAPGASRNTQIELRRRTSEYAINTLSHSTRKHCLVDHHRSTLIRSCEHRGAD